MGLWMIDSLSATGLSTGMVNFPCDDLLIELEVACSVEHPVPAHCRHNIVVLVESLWRYVSAKDASVVADIFGGGSRATIFALSELCWGWPWLRKA